MSKLDQWTPDRSMKELLVALKQLEHNSQTIYAHSKRSVKVQDLCLAIYKASQALQGWVDQPGHTKIVVAWQPVLFDYETDDTMYGEE